LRTEARKRMIRVAQVVLSLAIVIGIFAFAIPKIANYGDVWRAVQAMSWLELTTLLLVTALNIFAYWPVMVASMPGLTIAQAAVNNQASTSIANTLPGGGWIANGVTYAMYRSWGFTNQSIGLTTIVTGVWNSFIKLGMPVVALAALALSGQASSTLILPMVVGVAVLLAAIALFTGVLWKESVARAIGRRLGKAVSFVRKPSRETPLNWGETAVQFRKQSIGLIVTRWPALTISASASHVALYLVLLLALRHVGVSEREVTWAQVLGVFAFVRLISLLPLTPGGVGLVELGYIGGLYVAGKARADVPLDVFKAQIAAAVLVFRALTFVLQIPLGAAAYVVWQRKKSWRKPAPKEAKERASEVSPVAR
jgi:putative heme transporter